MDLEIHRGVKYFNEITKAQAKFIKKCRVHERPVPYSVMAELWEDEMEWGSISKSTMIRITKLLLRGKMKVV